MAKNVLFRRSKTPEYRAWCHMKERCYNTNIKNYDRYGGRGIKVHEDWVNDFYAFYDYIGPRPSDSHSLDRIDNNGHYEPGNVRWATIEEQSFNKSNNINIELEDGRIVRPKDMADELNIQIKTIYKRFNKGIPLNTPLKEYNRIKYPYNDQYFTIAQIARLENIPHYLLRKYIDPNLSLKEAITQALNEIITRYYKDDGSRVQLREQHGMVNTYEYRLWNRLKNKCYNPKHQDFPSWGAKGATMCDNWRYNFNNFISGIGLKPGPNYSLKIKDLSKPIGPGNITWVEC